MTDKIPAVLDAVFESTLNMINQDFAEFPEHRVAFFRLLRAINATSFEVLVVLPSSQFKLLMDAVVWATKHTMRDIADIGLKYAHCTLLPSPYVRIRLADPINQFDSICVELIDNIVAAGPSISNGFFQAYYLSLLQDMFFVLTDTDHKSGTSFILLHSFAASCRFDA